MDRDERLMAYVDGELDPEGCEAMERELARDPELQREVQRQQALRRTLGEAFDPVLEEPVPLQLTLAAATANQTRGEPRRLSLSTVGAMAACLVIGVTAARWAEPPAGPLASRNGALVAQGTLAQTLDRALAADPGKIRVGLTFRTAQGRYCRTFQSAPDQLAGVACRDPQGWKIQVAAAWRPAGDAPYRQAGSDAPAPVLAAVDELISGDPLDIPAERAARDGGWRR
jgi:hypothetical protein